MDNSGEPGGNEPRETRRRLTRSIRSTDKLSELNLKHSKVRSSASLDELIDQTKKRLAELEAQAKINKLQGNKLPKITEEQEEQVQEQEQEPGIGNKHEDNEEEQWQEYDPVAWECAGQINDTVEAHSARVRFADTPARGKQYKSFTTKPAAPLVDNKSKQIRLPSSNAVIDLTSPTLPSSSYKAKSSASSKSLVAEKKESKESMENKSPQSQSAAKPASRMSFPPKSGTEQELFDSLNMKLSNENTTKDDKTKTSKLTMSVGQQPKAFSKFLKLESKIQDRIIELALADHGPDFFPLYQTGRLARGPWSDPLGSDIIETPNIVIPSLFFVSKAVSTKARKVFYGTNVFRLRVADAAKWFLKKIGPENAQFLRKVHLIMHTGWLINIEPNDFEACQERQWAGFIGLARDNPYNLNTHLAYFEITLIDWIDPDNMSALDDFAKDEVAKQRFNLVNQLKDFGGIKTVRIFSNTNFMSRKELASLALLMQQPWSPKPPGPRLNLAQLMEKCRLEEEERMNFEQARFTEKYIWPGEEVEKIQGEKAMAKGMSEQGVKGG